MNNELTFERYQALNRTFRKELIFHLGSVLVFTRSLII